MTILNNMLKFNIISLQILVLLFFGCKTEVQRYQFVDNITRFDTITGEVELLQKDGEWLSKKETIEKDSHLLSSNLEQEGNQPVKDMVYFLY